MTGHLPTCARPLFGARWFVSLSLSLSPSPSPLQVTGYLHVGTYARARTWDRHAKASEENISRCRPSCLPARLTDFPNAPPNPLASLPSYLTKIARSCRNDVVLMYVYASVCAHVYDKKKSTGGRRRSALLSPLDAWMGTAGTTSGSDHPPTEKGNQEGRSPHRWRAIARFLVGWARGEKGTRSAVA